MLSKVDIHVAPALDTLKTLKRSFDFAFIDADKTNYQNYFERCLKLVRRGGIFADYYRTQFAPDHTADAGVPVSV